MLSLTTTNEGVPPVFYLAHRTRASNASFCFVPNADQGHSLRCIMSMAHVSQSARYKAAIALNNSAVTLLEREFYRDSVDTFRLAISLIQSAIEDFKNPSGVERSCNFYESVNHQLQQTWKRCAIACVPNQSGHSNNGFVLIKFYSQQDPCGVEDAIFQASRGGIKKVFACVILEPNDDDENHCLDSIGLDSNSILYNFAVAHCLLAYQLGISASKSEPVLIDELRQGAFQLFCLIEPFFLGRLSNFPLLFQGREFLLVCALFAQTMSEVANQMQQTAVGENYKKTLHAIVNSMNAQEALIPVGSRHASAA
jgi:hypothetical protein